MFRDGFWLHWVEGCIIVGSVVLFAHAVAAVIRWVQKRGREREIARQLARGEPPGPIV
jgi:hypothetical protein